MLASWMTCSLALSLEECKGKIKDEKGKRNENLGEKSCKVNEISTRHRKEIKQ